MDGIDSSLLFDFVEEATEHLKAIEDDFMTLENNLENPDPETINTIFRSIHTVKGSCGFLNLVSMGSLSHAMETVLSQLRDGTMVPTSEMLDLLLEGIDVIMSMLGDVENSNAIDPSTLISSLEALLPGDRETEKAVTLNSNNQELGDVERELLSQLKRGVHLYHIEVNLTQWESKFGRSPLQFVNELSQFGTILTGELKVSQGDIREKAPEGDTYYHLYFKTAIEPDIIGALPIVEPEMIRSITADTIIEEPVVDDSKGVSKTDSTSVEQHRDVKPEKSGVARSASGGSDTLRVRVDILNELMMLAGELVLVRNQQLLQQDRADSASRAITQRLDIVTSDLQETIMRTRMQPVGNVFGKFTRIVRDLAKGLNKQIELVTTGAEVELDKNILEALSDPLTHMIRNSCDHGIELPADRAKAGKNEKGIIQLKAYHEGGQINIEIVDNGNGISTSRLSEKVLEKGLKTEEELAAMSGKELLSMIFLPGLSTAEKVSDLSGRGVGMDVVKTSIESLGGVIDIDSEEGVGTTFSLRLPLTLAIIPSLIVKVADERFAIPQVNLEELVCLYDEDVRNKIECVGNREVYRLRDDLLPMVRLNELLDQSTPFDERIKGEITERNNREHTEKWSEWKRAKENGETCNWSLNFAVLKVGSSRFGLIIDSILGTEEIVVKPMHRAVKDLGIYSGATVLGDGEVAMILDVLGLSRHAAVDFDTQNEPLDTELAGKADENKESLLLFSNEGEEQFGIQMKEVKRVERLEMTRIEHVGQREFVTIDGVSTRVIRLEECLQLSSGMEREEMFLILPKVSQQPYGVLTSKLLDIGEFEVALNTESFSEAGVTGSAILKEHMTLLLEPDKLAQIIEPEWYLTEG